MPCRFAFIHYINQGHNGWTSGQIAHSIEKLGLVRADVYTVFLGTNDWWHANPIGDWADYAGNTGADPAGDEYPYPPEAMNITYDGLHPSDKGDSIIAHQLIKVLKKV